MVGMYVTMFVYTHTQIHTHTHTHTHRYTACSVLENEYERDPLVDGCI
jgi:hypothetical protein